MITKKLILRHFGGWFLYVTYEVVYLRFTSGHFAPVFTAALFYTLNIGLFYFNAHVLLDFSFAHFRKGLIAALFLMVPELLAYFLIKYTLDSILTSHPYSHFRHNEITWMYTLANVWRGGLFIGLSTGYWSVQSALKLREENHLIETEQLMSVAKNLELENKVISIENAYLQGQISPHLVYNSLNFIYSSIYLMSESAGKGVMLLADLMRYSLAGASDGRTVLLAEEWREMEKLIELCRLRFGDLFFVRCRKRGKMAGIRIIPLVLITLVENMLKHGDVGEKNFPARISVDVNENEVVFSALNKKRRKSLHAKGGLGLQNIKKRLSNAYRDNFRLVIEDGPESFSVTLILQL